MGNDKLSAALSLVGAVALPLAGGFAGSLVTLPEIKGWYSKLKKPRWNPPNWLFGPAWAVLYTAQGVASWFVWRQRATKKVAAPLILYAVQLALNFAWSPIFFKLHRPAAAAVDSTAMLGVATAATVLMARTAGSEKILPLMVPYLGWLTFATVLAATIAVKNPDAHKLTADSSDKPAAGKAAAEKPAAPKAAAEKAAEKPAAPKAPAAPAAAAAPAAPPAAPVAPPAAPVAPAAAPVPPPAAPKAPAAPVAPAAPAVPKA